MLQVTILPDAIKRHCETCAHGEDAELIAIAAAAMAELLARRPLTPTQCKADDDERPGTCKSSVHAAYNGAWTEIVSALELAVMAATNIRAGHVVDGASYEIASRNGNAPHCRLVLTPAEALP